MLGFALRHDIARRGVSHRSACHDRGGRDRRYVAIQYSWLITHREWQCTHRSRETCSEPLDADSLAWAGERGGEPMTEVDRAAVWMASGSGTGRRESHTTCACPRAPSRTRVVRPGFRTALPRAEHSDGWSVTDLHQSPECPDPDHFPPTIEYSGPEGTAEIGRSIEVVEELPHERFRDVVDKIHVTALSPETLAGRAPAPVKR